MRFQNGCNKEAISLRIVQSWSETDFKSNYDHYYFQSADKYTELLDLKFLFLRFTW